MKKKLSALILAGVLMLSTVACTQVSGITNNLSDKTNIQINTESTNLSSKVDGIDLSTLFSNQDKEIGYDQQNATKINLANESITITEKGTYILSGDIQNGQIVIDADEKDDIVIVLDNVNISNNTSSAIYVKQANKVFITLAKDSVNTLSNKGEFVETEDDIDGVIFSKSDITLNGQGKLTVNANYGNGIVSKENLIITSGTYEITSANHSIKSKDSIKIANGNFKINSQKDALHAENNDDTESGYIYIGGGDFDIQSVSDAIDAVSLVQIDGGNIKINSQDDGIHSDDKLIINGGNIDISDSYEGIEGKRVDITGGKINLLSQDDGINATDGSTKTTQTDESMAVNNTNSSTNQSDYNIELKNENLNQKPPIQNANRHQAPPMPNGQNPEIKQDMKNHQMNINEQIKEPIDDVYINVSGGSLKINAQGDGIDSNGNLTISGGEIYLSGPTSSDNGALDFDGQGSITGGTIITTSSKGMVQNFDSNSTQGSISINLNKTQLAGSKVLVKDSNGNEIVSYTAEKEYSCILVSSPQIYLGGTYIIIAGDETHTIKMDKLIYGQNGFGERRM